MICGVSVPFRPRRLRKLGYIYLGYIYSGMATDHHSVYVVYLRNPKGDGRAGYYVGMTGLTPEQRFKNHKTGIKAARVVKTYGVRLVPKLFAHLNPMPYAKALEMEAMLAESLRKRGYAVYGGH
jgi:predicted GIY-YIG superfamily endonuclease